MDNFLQIDDGIVLESGMPLRPVKVAYRTFGKMNEAKDNIIVVVHALTANASVDDWWNGLFGPDKLFDPNRYFIVCANNLGSPYGTTSPVNHAVDGAPIEAPDFPFYTIRDMAMVHQHFLEALGVDNIYLLIGPSCGGNIAQEMAYFMGDRIKHLALLCCSAQETPWVIAIHEAQRQALMVDPAFRQGRGNGQGLKAARAMAMPFYRSHASFNVRQAEADENVLRAFRASSYIAYQGEKFNKRFDAQCYYQLINALDTHHMARNRPSLERAFSEITAKTLCMGFSSDILVPTVEQEKLHELIAGSTYCEVDTIYGHDAFLIESDKVNTAIRSFLHK